MFVVSRRVCLFALVGLLCPAVNSLRADVTHTSTVIVVGEMCGGCVKRITEKLKPMKNVAKIDCSIEEKSVTVVPVEGKTLSPRTLWEAMDEIGKTPKKLTGPSGTYTSKPKK